jgi:putative inorganic carbon (hco3(-)) transporter
MHNDLNVEIFRRFPAGGKGPWNPASYPAVAPASSAQPRFERAEASGSVLSFKLMVLFLVLLYTNIAVLFPALEPLRPMLIVALSAIGVLLIERSLAGLGFVTAWPESHLLIAFLGAIGISIVTALWMRQAANATMDLAKMVAIYFLIINTVENGTRLRRISWCMVVGGMIPALFTVRNYLQGTVGNDGRSAWIGIFGNPNELAYSLIILIPIAIALSMAHGLLVRAATWGVVALYMAAIFLTYSRGGFIGLVLVLALTGFRLYSRMAPLFLVVVLAGVLFYVGNYWKRDEGFSDLGSDASFQQRIATIHAGYDMFLDHPVLGVGAGCFIIAWPLYAPKATYTKVALVNHNTFMQVLSETGVVGFLPFVLLMASAVLQAQSAIRMLREKGSPYTALGIALETAFYGFLVCGLSGGFALTWFPYLLLGLISALKRIAWREPEALPSLAAKGIA